MRGSSSGRATSSPSKSEGGGLGAPLARHRRPRYIRTNGTRLRACVENYCGIVRWVCVCRVVCVVLPVEGSGRESVARFLCILIYKVSVPQARPQPPGPPQPRLTITRARTARAEIERDTERLGEKTTQYQSQDETCFHYVPTHITVLYCGSREPSVRSCLHCPLDRCRGPSHARPSSPRELVSFHPRPPARRTARSGNGSPTYGGAAPAAPHAPKPRRVRRLCLRGRRARGVSTGGCGAGPGSVVRRAQE